MKSQDVLTSIWTQDFIKVFLSQGLTLDWLRGKDCLDAGGGSGIFSAALAFWGARRVVYLDIHPLQLAKAKRVLSSVGGSQCILGDITWLPFAYRSLDCVISARVLHHIKEPQVAVRELERVCRTEGLLYQGVS